MTWIELQTSICAPQERCFDLARSVELHLDAATDTRERVVGGVDRGLLGLGDEVVWEARHFGLWHRLSTQITVFDRPRKFRDEMIDGPFRQLVHDHSFEPTDQGTIMRDTFGFASALRPLDRLALKPHLRRFLERRNEAIRQAAETALWRRYLTG